MVEPVTTGVLLGAGWFANKLLGPSADALGEQLKIYASSRLEKIFKRTEDINSDSLVYPLPTVFAHLAIEQASISDDADNITEMWANLLANTGNGRTAPNLLFVEILSKLNSADVELLDKFLSLNFIQEIDSLNDQITSMPYSAITYAKCGGERNGLNNNAVKVANDISSRIISHSGSFDIFWREFLDLVHSNKYRSIYESIHFEHDQLARSDDGSAIHVSNSNVSQNLMSFEKLINQGLLVRYPASTGLGSIMRLTVTTLSPTPLAVEFVKACRGIQIVNTKGAT